MNQISKEIIVNDQKITLETGKVASGAMIALTAATIFAIVATFQIVVKPSSEA